MKAGVMGEAFEWVRCCPNLMRSDSEIEIRPIFEAEDFGESCMPELPAQEEQLRRQIARKDPDGA